MLLGDEVEDCFEMNGGENGHGEMYDSGRSELAIYRPEPFTKGSDTFTWLS